MDDKLASSQQIWVEGYACSAPGRNRRIYSPSAWGLGCKMASGCRGTNEWKRSADPPEMGAAEGLTSYKDSSQSPYPTVFSLLFCEIKWLCQRLSKIPVALTLSECISEWHLGTCWGLRLSLSSVYLPYCFLSCRMWALGKCLSSLPRQLILSPRDLRARALTKIHNRETDTQSGTYGWAGGVRQER